MALPLRMVAATRRLGRFRGQARIGVTLARRYGRPGAAQVGADGFVLRIDSADQFQALMLLGLFDRGLVECVRTYAEPGSVVVDCGANVGYIALHAARSIGPGGSVEAFECDPRMAEVLREHARLNDASINVRELAVWNESGPIKLHVSEQPGWSSLQQGAAPSGTETQVMAVSLDAHLAEQDIDPERVSLIKLDVEGAEPEALEGARGLLDAGTPALVVEIDANRSRRLGKNPEGIFNLLGEQGYRAAEVIGDRSADPRTDVLSRPGPTDVVFVKS